MLDREERQFPLDADYTSANSSPFPARSGLDFGKASNLVSSNGEQRPSLVQAPGADYPRDASVPELFAAQVRLSPDAIALRDGHRAWSYAALDRYSNRLAHRLLQRGVTPGMRVALLLERSLETVAAHLAVLKVEAAYVPLDPGYPASLLAFMLEDAKPALVLSQRRFADVAGLGADRGGPVLWLDEETPGGETSADTAPPVPEIAPTDVAYVMYTSGSTGRPKGVMVPHRAIVRLVKNTNFASLGADEVFLQLAPLAFDAATLEIWGPLLNGGQLAVMRGARPSLDEIGAAVRDFGVTTLWLTAGLFHLMVDQRLADLAGLRQLLAGGDVLSPSHVARALQALPNTRLINGYGPTENTTFTCCYTIPPDHPPACPIPVGRPISHTAVYILDEDFQPVPDGAVGQLCAGGDGVALGYLGRPELTAERFIADPFAGDARARMYLTGDFVRRRPDGIIEFLGRRDGQVKINGQRIELEEVEAALRGCEGVLDAAAAVSVTPSGAKRIVAAVVYAPSQTPDEKALRCALAGKLPSAAVPSDIAVVDALPLGPTGKVDRHKLAELRRSRPDRGSASLPPRNADEELVAAVWRDVLRLDEIGIDDAFFDLGGTSLQLLAAHQKLCAESGVALAVTDLFACPTVRALAPRLREVRTPSHENAAALARASRGQEALRRLRQKHRE